MRIPLVPAGVLSALVVTAPVLTALWAPQLRAQEAAAPQAPVVENAEPRVVVDPAASEEREGGNEGASLVDDPFAGQSVDDALAALRALEARLSLGDALTPAERRRILGAAAKSPDAGVRAQAIAIVPWLPPEEAGPALLPSIDDADPRGRALALQGLLALARRLPDGVRGKAIEYALLRLDDDEDEVACAAAELASALDATRAHAEIRQRAPRASPVRYACWNRVAGLPLTRAVVPKLPEAPGLDDDAAPGQVAPAVQAPARGDWLFLTTAFGAGAVVGAFAPSAFLPARELMTYTPRRTSLSHEEVSILTSLLSTTVGAAALGGMGLALDLGVGPPTLEGASASVLATSSGALAGLGLTLLSGRDQQLASAALSASTLVGFGAGALSAYVLNPTVEDIAFGTAVGAMTTAATTLAAFAAVPVGNARVYGDVSRIDFSLGLGLGVGGIAGLSALLLGPIVEVPPARMLAAGAGGAVGAVVGLAAGFLPVPTDVDVRVRVGAGAGLAGLLVGATLGALFVPDAWVAAPLGRPEPSPSALLVVERGHVRLGAPAIMTSATSVGLAVVGGAL